MKKSLFVLGVAVAALASCTSEEVVDVAQNRAIKFDSFVNNNTRAVTEVKANNNFTKFFVEGYYDTNTAVYGEFLGVTGTIADAATTWKTDKNAYWENAKYQFGAYSDGNSNLKTEVTAAFTRNTTADKSTLKISNYTPDNTRDLVAAISAEVECVDKTVQQNPVPLTFKHMLSQVIFTFNTTDAHTYTLKISNIQIKNAVKTGEGILTGPDAANATWTGTATDANTVAYTFDALNDIASDPGAGKTHSTASLVIPQDNENLTVTFKASYWNTNNPAEGKEADREGTFTANLKYTQSTVTGTTTGKWTSGFRYNYTATINASMIKDPDVEGLIPIEFTVTDVTGWENADDTPVTPSADEPTVP